VLAVAAVLVGLAFAGSPAELPTGARIAGVDVGGLDEHDAVAKLEREYATVAARPVRFTAAGRTFSYSASQLGVEPDWRAAVGTAADAGSGVGPIRGLRRLFARVVGVDVVPDSTSSSSAVDYAVATVAADVDRAPRSAALVRHGLRIDVVEDRPGRRLDRAAAAGVVVRALGSLQREDARTQLPVRALAPSVTAVSLAAAARRARVAVSAPLYLRGTGLSWRLSRTRVASLLQLPSGGAARLAIGGPAADAWFLRLSQRFGKPSVDARFAAAGASIRVVPSKTGLELDVPATARALLRAATSRSNRVAHASLAQALPRHTTADLLALGIDRRMSTYKTFNAGTADRITNLRLGVEKLDGTLVAPRGAFSLNRAIGARTSARGFKVAPVIIGTQYAEEVGGGTSQVATTVFNAAWEAGLRITERNPHALYISRYPLGRDATVYWPALDLES